MLERTGYAGFRQGERFYAELLGWKSEPSKTVEMEYPAIHVQGKTVGGMMQMGDGYKMPETSEPMPSHCMTYTAVEKVDAAEKIAQFGG